MTGDPAARWRAGRLGYGRRLRLVVTPTPQHDDAAARVRDAIRSAACHYRHGRAGALYCQEGRP